MAKKIKFESFKYRFLIAAENKKKLFSGTQISWEDFIEQLFFCYNKGSVEIIWHIPSSGSLLVPLTEVQFYSRGDNEKAVARQESLEFLNREDPVKLKNDEYFNRIVAQVAKLAHFEERKMQPTEDQLRLNTERDFHDEWANNENLENIDIVKINNACTAPEMRYIRKKLGEIKGKKILDVGCGLGEASVYFALLGANVTSSDLSEAMLKATEKLARAHGVSVNPHVSSVEDLQLPIDSKFDVIYCGNLLHHVEIDRTLELTKRHLADDGIFISWDPLAYNPIINIYRKIATDVRTPDEHPLTIQDIKIFEKHFNVVETQYYWLTTLIIFIIMALFQRRNPNKERFWKTVVHEGEKWEWLYYPLEKFDRFLLKLFKPLQYLCWNVVVVSSKPR